MPKLKTHKSISKRIKITRNGKMIKKRAGQAHFNSRESGSITRAKRRSSELSKVYFENIKQLLPYN